MSLAPLPIKSITSLPLPSEGLTATPAISELGQASAGVILAATPDFAELMADIGKGASEPMSLEGKECCSIPDTQAIPQENFSPERDSQAEDTLSTVDELRAAPVFFEPPVPATKDVRNADASDPRYPALQTEELSGETVNAPPRHPNLTEKAGSETHPDEPANGPSRAETLRQIPDSILDSDGPVGITSVRGGAPKVRDRVISLQEFTFVDGAARNGMLGMTHASARPAPHPATDLTQPRADAFTSVDRDTPLSLKTETVLPRKPSSAAVVSPIETADRFALPQPSREPMASPRTVAASPQHVESEPLQPQQTVEKNGVGREPAALTKPKSTSAWHEANFTAVVARSAETPGSASDPKRLQAVPDTALRTVPISSTPSVAIHDLTWGAGTSENRPSPLQIETPAVNRLKTPASGLASMPKARNLAPIAADLAAFPITVAGGVSEGQIKDDMAEGLTPAAINPATAVPRPEAAIPRVDVPRHIAQQVADVAMRAADGPVDLHLNPEELGKVRISMAMADGGIAVNIQAERPETLDLMRRHIDQLNQEFRQLGYGLISFSFGQHKQGQDNQSDGAPDQAASAAPEDQTGLIHAGGGHGPRNGLDMRI